MLELLLDVFSRGLLVDAANEESRDALILGRSRNFEVLNFVDDLLRERIIDAVEPFPDPIFHASLALLHRLEVLLSNIVVTIGTGAATIALALHEKAADVGQVSARLTLLLADAHVPLLDLLEAF